jgi:hypothetical protein
MNELKSIAELGGNLGEQRSGILVVESVSLSKSLALGSVSEENLRRHEGPPMTMDLTLLTVQSWRKG